MRLLISLVCLSLLAVAEPAFAQQQEPPARVGAVSDVSGNLAFHTAGETQWSAAGINYPVATGGSFWTDAQARAQIQIGPSTLALAGGTELDVTNLNEQASQFAVPQGRIYLHLRQLDAGQSFEIDTPQGAVWLLQPGTYDVDAGTADQPARVAVFEGSARFVGGGADVGIKAGDAAVLSGSNPVTAQMERATADAFVESCRSHDYHEQGLAASHYVSPHMTGYADLDHYGAWQSNPQYGEVWYPSQTPADWAPYRDGRWIWVQPWGWTWVDQQPWGFAPFHYGRWANVGDRWGWVPGQYAEQPVYAPALVAFVGAAAGGFGLVGEAGPSVGWFPLAPNEPYWPSYTRNVNYIRNVNITNVKNINTIVIQSNGAPPAQAANANFANRRFATVVPQRVFANADPVAPAKIKVSPAALEKAPVVLHPPEVKPAPKPAGAALRGPENARPVPVGPGVAPPGHPGPARPGPAVSGLPGIQPHPPGTPPERAVGPGRPGTPANVATIPPHPGAVNAPERGTRIPSAVGTAPAPGTPERGAPHPAPAPNTAALPPPRPGGLPPAREARPGVVEPGRPPAATAVRRPAPPPAAAPERRPAAVNEARPAAPLRPATPPRPQPPAQAQAFHPPAPVPRPVPAAPRPAAPAMVRPVAPVAARPPAPAMVRPVAPVAARPPAPAMVRSVAPVAARPPAPAAVRAAPPVERPVRAAAPAAPSRPQPAEAAHGGGKPAPKKEGEK